MRVNRGAFFPAMRHLEVEGDVFCRVVLGERQGEIGLVPVRLEQGPLDRLREWHQQVIPTGRVAHQGDGAIGRHVQVMRLAANRRLGKGPGIGLSNQGIELTPNGQVGFQIGDLRDGHQRVPLESSTGALATAACVPPLSAASARAWCACARWALAAYSASLA